MRKTPSRAGGGTGQPRRAGDVVTGAVADVAPGPGGYVLPRFPAVIPDAVRQGATEHARLVIVGAGLTGLTLAADLATRGVQAVLLDDDDTVGARGASSRGIVYVQKSLEIMARLGTAQRMMERGVAWATGTTLSGQHAVYRFSRAAEERFRLPAFVNLQQFYVEWFLVQRLAELGAQGPRWRNAVTGIEADAEGVRLSVATPAGPYAIAADWVVDASGAHSAIRRAVGVAMETAHHADRWCICDVRCPGLDVPERRTWVDAPFNGGRAVWQHPMADGVWRLDYQLGPDGDPDEAARPEVAKARVREHLGPDLEFELVWVGAWSYRAQLIDRFRQGRVLFAGDAAHVMSPFGARGGNSGIQDAENLAWKLALVLAGRADPRLLDSYGEERRPAAEENIRVTSRTARFLAPRSGFERRLRAAVLGLAREHDFARSLVNTGRLSTPNRYASSSVLGAEGGFAVPDFELEDATGRRLWLGELMASLGTRSLGLYLPEAGEGALRGAIIGLDAGGRPWIVRDLDPGDGLGGCALRDPGGELARLAGLGRGDFVVIRPDLYCAGVVRQAGAAEARALLDLSVGAR
jgi:3-(3-hydroxy-phenyl)propionate hydroxylase